MGTSDLSQFQNLTFDDFRRRAQDDSLSPHEKVGFPDAYREGREESILADIRRKLDKLDQSDQVVVDIGPGCSGLAFMMIELCRQHGHRLLLVDSQEMLDQLPDQPFITKVPAYYPRDCRGLITQLRGQVNAILVYSLLQIVFAEGNVFDFLDSSLSMLADGGEMLIGDIPNISKRKRLFSSANGIKFHQAFMETSEVPSVTFNVVEPGKIDDAVLASILMRCRSAGYDAYWLPQAGDLPFANRREDLLIHKP